jgi:hypothetical protein
MKKIKNLLFILLLITLASATFAQSFGVKAGLNLSNMVVKDDDDTYSDDYKMLPGFHLGVVADIPFSDMFSFEPGLLLSTKGFKYDLSEEYLGETMESKMKMSLYYLDIPLNLKASFGSDDTKFFVTFGPYLGMGLSGKTKSEVTFMGETESDEADIKWGTDEENDDLKRLDFGIAVGAGVQFGAITAGAGYQLGLANASPYTDNGSSIKNKVISVSVGYMFGGK